MKAVEIHLFAGEQHRVGVQRGPDHELLLDVDDVALIVRALRSESDRVMPWESKMLTLVADVLEDL